MHHHHAQEPQMHRESRANASTTTTTTERDRLTADEVHAIALVLSSSESLDARMDAIDAIVYGQRTPHHVRLTRAMSDAYAKLARRI
jgi:hypothetical protein